VNGRDAEHTLPNYNKGDVIVNFAAINLEPAWNLDNTPRIELCLEGSGVVEIHFLNIVQGGVALISVDNPVDLGDIIGGIIGDGIDSIDLNQDIISLPPETTEEIIIEVEIATEGEHIVYIYFLPTVNDSLIPLQFGGGLREISLCGNIRPCGTPAPEPPPPLEGVTELVPEFRFTADCGLEYQLRNQENEIVLEWQVVPGWIDNAFLCFGVGMATKQDIKEALIEWTEDTASRYLGVLLDEDGNPTIPPSEGGESGGVVDNPLTPQNEASEARDGGCRAITEGYNKIWFDMNDWKTDGLTADVISFRLQQKYLMVDDATTDNFVALYFAIYATGHINSYGDSLSEMIYCGGDNVKSIVAEYIIDSIADILQENAFGLNTALADEQITQWFNAGAQIPSTAYYAYPCHTIPIEEFILDMSTANAPSYTTSGVWKAGHRFLFEVSGSFEDTDVVNQVGDALYVHNTLTGVKTFSALGIASGGGLEGATNANTPFSPTHVYRWTVGKPKELADSTAIISRDNGAMAIPNVTGILTFKITDLGQYE
jgi:hypothetical protein